MMRKDVEHTKDEKGYIRINDMTVDRDRDRVFPSGAVLENYLKHPVVLFGHDGRSASAVIGHMADVVQTYQEIKGKPDLRDPAGPYDVQQQIVRQLWDKNLLAASVGFEVLESEPNAYGGRDITMWELYEVSLCPLPSNPSALRLERMVKQLGDLQVKAGPNWAKQRGRKSAAEQLIDGLAELTLEVQAFMLRKRKNEARQRAIARKIAENPDVLAAAYSNAVERRMAAKYGGAPYIWRRMKPRAG